jgi:hypothetical protein
MSHGFAATSAFCLRLHGQFQLLDHSRSDNGERLTTLIVRRSPTAGLAPSIDMRCAATVMVT